METRDFFSTFQRMRGYRGDTFPVWEIITDADDLTGCSMTVVLEDAAHPGAVAFTKACTRNDTGEGLGFAVQLLSSETAELRGTYTVHFIMTDASSHELRKLVGTLVVLDCPEVS